MQYGRRDFESYRDRYDRDDWQAPDRREDEQWRSRDRQGFRGDDRDPESWRQPGREYRGAELRQRDSRLDYPDRYSAGTGFRESFANQGAQRSHLRCRDIMTRNVTTCDLNTNIQKIAQLMRYEDIGAIPVLNEEGRLEGIVTDRDIVVGGLTKDRADAELKASDCMSTDLYVAQQNDRLVDVINEMGDHQIRRVPVVDSRNRLVGIISMADVATQTQKDRELGDALEEISKPGSWLGRLANYFGL
jgi:CBS domain-containing protein